MHEILFDCVSTQLRTYVKPALDERERQGRRFMRYRVPCRVLQRYAAANEGTTVSIESMLSR